MLDNIRSIPAELQELQAFPAATETLREETLRACHAVGGMELDVNDGRAIHVVLDDAGPGGTQVEQRHQTIGGAHSTLQAAVIESQCRQALASLVHTKHKSQMHQGGYGIVPTNMHAVPVCTMLLHRHLMPDFACPWGCCSALLH